MSLQAVPASVRHSVDSRREHDGQIAHSLRPCCFLVRDGELPTVSQPFPPPSCAEGQTHSTTATAFQIIGGLGAIRGFQLQKCGIYAPLSSPAGNELAQCLGEMRITPKACSPGSAISHDAATLATAIHGALVLRVSMPGLGSRPSLLRSDSEPLATWLLYIHDVKYTDSAWFSYESAGIRCAFFLVCFVLQAMPF